jgi:hypothetical protein
MEAGTTVCNPTAAAATFRRRTGAGRIGEKRVFLAKCRPKHKQRSVDFPFGGRETMIHKIAPMIL